MVSEVKESSDFWTIFDLFQGLSEQFVQVLCIYYENSTYFKDNCDQFSTSHAFMVNFRPVLWTLLAFVANSTYFKDIVDNFIWI